jgi:hypothetical protein
MDVISPTTSWLDIILAIVQIFTLIALIIYVKKTWDMAVATEVSAKSSESTLQEMKETRDQEIAPYIVCYFEMKGHHIYLNIENVGKGLAKDIKFEFSPKIRSVGYDVSETPLIKNGIPSMPPNYKIQTFFDSSPRYLNSELPLTYNVKIIFYGGLGNKKRISEQIIDLEYIKGIHFISENRMHDLVKEVEKIRKVQEDILKNLENN